MITLRPDQTAALDALRASLGRGNKRVMIQASTGWGKTVFSAAIVQGALAKGKRVMFVVPAISLIDQTVASFRAMGVSAIGVIQANHELTNYGHPVQVCSVQTLERRKIPFADLVIIDECHRLFRLYPRWMAEWGNIPFIGLSATPWTKGLGKYFQDLIIAGTTQDLIDKGILSKFKAYAPGHPDLSGVGIVAGDYHEGQLGEAMDKQPLVADIVETWKKYGENRPTLLFAVNRAHAKHCQMAFHDHGITADYIDANTESEERHAIRDRFHAGETKIVCNVGCLTTGIDWDVRCIILARPTRSEMLYVQMIGRGLRTANGKDHCLILDHSDTTQTLGFVTDIHHDTLDLGKKTEKTKPKPKEQLPKECPSCHFLKPPRTAKCPQCGYVGTKPSEVETVGGELVELKSEKFDMATKTRWYQMLLHYATEKGYKSGWAANKYRDKFGVWPKEVLSAKPIEPDEKVSSWITSQNIKWSKSRKRAQAPEARQHMAESLAKIEAILAEPHA